MRPCKPLPAVPKHSVQRSTDTLLLESSLSHSCPPPGKVMYGVKPARWQMAVALSAAMLATGLPVHIHSEVRTLCAAWVGGVGYGYVAMCGWLRRG